VQLTPHHHAVVRARRLLLGVVVTQGRVLAVAVTPELCFPPPGSPVARNARKPGGLRSGDGALCALPAFLHHSLLRGDSPQLRLLTLVVAAVEVESETTLPRATVELRPHHHAVVRARRLLPGVVVTQVRDVLAVAVTQLCSPPPGSLDERHSRKLGAGLGSDHHYTLSRPLPAFRHSSLPCVVKPPRSLFTLSYPPRAEESATRPPFLPHLPCVAPYLSAPPLLPENNEKYSPGTTVSISHLLIHRNWRQLTGEETTRARLIDRKKGRRKKMQEAVFHFRVESPRTGADGVVQLTTCKDLLNVV
jgi:hypothetical protein